MRGEKNCCEMSRTLRKAEHGRNEVGAEVLLAISRELASPWNGYSSVRNRPVCRSTRLTNCTTTKLVRDLSGRRWRKRMGCCDMRIKVR
jgi:hypothetical protein